MKEYTTFEIIILWKRAKDDPFILRYLADLTGLSVNDIVFVLQCYGYQPDVKRALRAELPKDKPMSIRMAESVLSRPQRSQERASSILLTGFSGKRGKGTMGVTISCKKTGEGIDLGYSGFDRLRCKVAELIGGEFAKHYLLLSQPEIMFMMGAEKRARFYDEYNKKTAEIVEKEKVPVRIANFLYQSDCGGKIGFGACKQILKIVGDYDDDILYGYCGRSDCAKFADFVSILKSCAENKSDMVWM